MRNGFGRTESARNNKPLKRRFARNIGNSEILRYDKTAVIVLEKDRRFVCTETREKIVSAERLIHFIAELMKQRTHLTYNRLHIF
jgi:hypothetical protein